MVSGHHRFIFFPRRKTKKNQDSERKIKEIKKEKKGWRRSSEMRKNLILIQ